MLILLFAGSAQWRFFQGSGILHFGKIGYRLTQHSPTFTGRAQLFDQDGLLFEPNEWIKLFTLPPLRIIHYVLKYNPAYLHIQGSQQKIIQNRLSALLRAAVLAGLYWFVERWKNSFQKKHGRFLVGREAAI